MTKFDWSKAKRRAPRGYCQGAPLRLVGRCRGQVSAWPRGPKTVDGGFGRDDHLIQVSPVKINLPAASDTNCSRGSVRLADTRPMPVQLLAFRAVRKGALRGFASIQMGALKINDVSIFYKDGRSWASLPSKPRVGRDGQPVTKDGKTVYQQICEWASKESSERFSEAVSAAIRESHPGDLEPAREVEPA
jgi:hypothetical protein